MKWTVISTATIKKHPHGCPSAGYWVHLEAFAAARGLDVKRDTEEAIRLYEGHREGLKSQAEKLRVEIRQLEARARELEAERKA